MPPLYIIGTSGLAREMAFVFGSIQQSEWSLEGFIAAESAEIGRDLGFASVVGDDAWLLDGASECGIVIGVGIPAVKERIVARYAAASARFTFPSFVHPTAVLDERLVRLGRGNMVTAGCVFTCDIDVGDFNLFNLQTTVGHDVQVGNYCVFNPSVNISGGVQVGNGVLLGTGAQILENRILGDRVTVGAGAVVTKDVDAEMTVVGVPARPLGAT